MRMGFYPTSIHCRQRLALSPGSGIQEGVKNAGLFSTCKTEFLTGHHMTKSPTHQPAAVLQILENWNSKSAIQAGRGEFWTDGNKTLFPLFLWLFAKATDNGIWGYEVEPRVKYRLHFQRRLGP